VTIIEHLSAHEAAHVFACVALGGHVEGVSLSEHGGLTNVAGLRRRGSIGAAVAGPIGERLLMGGELADGRGATEDWQKAQGHALASIKARRRIAARWRGVEPKTGAMDDAFAEAAEKGILAEVKAGVERHIQQQTERDIRRAGVIVAAAEERVGELLRANLVAVQYFADVLAKMETMSETDVLAVLDLATEKQKGEA
jgi:hypothetical protein